MSISNTNRWKLGLFVIIGVSLTIGALMWLGISQLQRKTTPAYLYFAESVSGLEVGSPVEFLGVEIGRVEAIFPAPDRRHIEVRVGIFMDTLEAWGISPSEYEHRIEGQSFVSDEIRAQLVTRALTSTSFIQIDLFDADKYPRPEYTFPIPWETIYTVPSTFKSLERGLTELLEKWPEIADRASSLLRGLDDGVHALDFVRINEQALTLFEGADSMMRQLRSAPILDGDSQTMRKFEAALDELNGLLRELRGSNGAVERFVGSFEGAAIAIQGDFEGSDIPAAVAAAEAAGAGFEVTSQEMSQLMRERRGSLTQLDATLRGIQSIAELLARDPAALLYGKSPSRSSLPK